MESQPRRTRDSQKKEDSHEMDLRWLLGSFRVLLPVKGNKGKDNDTGDRKRMVEKVLGCGMDEMKDVGVRQRPYGLLCSGGHSGPRLGRGRGVCHLTPEHSLCTHSPSVQFLESSSVPLQSRPPFCGGGAMHSRLRQCAHSVLQADHLLHSVHAPSTVGSTAHAVMHLNSNTETVTMHTRMQQTRQSVK